MKNVEREKADRERAVVAGREQGRKGQAEVQCIQAVAGRQVVVIWYRAEGGGRQAGEQEGRGGRHKK